MLVKFSFVDVAALFDLLLQSGSFHIGPLLITGRAKSGLLVSRPQIRGPVATARTTVVAQLPL